MESIRATKQNEPWRVVVTLEGGIDHFLSRLTEADADAFVKEAFERGFIKIPGAMKENQGDWSYYIPLHRIRHIEVHLDDKIAAALPTAQRPPQSFRPGLATPRK